MPTVKIPFVDEIVGSVVTTAHEVGVMENTIIFFLSTPDNSESPLEINIRRTAFVYSPLLKLQQRVSNQIVHVIDLLPTLVNASGLKWSTRDRIYIDGVNQWQAFNANEEERLDVYGDNFYISNYWKLTFGANDSAEFYGSIANENMESDEEVTGYDFELYASSIFSSEIHHMLEELSAQHVMMLKNRARVHCNLKDIGASAVGNIVCSRASPCLFDLLQDPCEFDNKHELEFSFRREQMKEIHHRYLTGEGGDVSSKSATATGMDDESRVGVILGSSVAACIIIFVIVVCVKERCNRRRSVYYDKSKKRRDKKEAKEGNQESAPNGDVNGIATISENVK